MRCIPRADVAPPFTVGPTEAERVDWRQQLFNHEEVGPITRVIPVAKARDAESLDEVGKDALLIWRRLQIRRASVS